MQNQRSKNQDKLAEELIQIIAYLDDNPKDFIKVSSQYKNLIAQVKETAFEYKDFKLQHLMARYVFHDPKDKNHEKYQSWLEMAVGHGSALAHIDLAFEYAHGEIYPEDPLEAGRLLSVVIEKN